MRLDSFPHGNMAGVFFASQIPRSCGRAMISPLILRDKSSEERKKFFFLFDYFFADDVRNDSAKLHLHLVQKGAYGGCSKREEAQLLMKPRRQRCISILGRSESKLTKFVQSFCVFNFCIFQEFFTGLRAPNN